MVIYVCNLAEMPGHVESLGPSHLVSLITPDAQPPTPAGVPQERHHRVSIHDINEPRDGHILPGHEHIEELIGFVQGWRHDDAPILVHCFAGISRSMAAALITLVVKAPGREAEAARQLRALAPHAWPNRRMIEVADELLDCNRRLVEAHAAMGPSNLSPWGPLVRVPLLQP